MPPKTYSYALTNGKTLDLEGDDTSPPPTDDEVMGLAKAQGVELVPADDAPTAPPSGGMPVNMGAPQAAPMPQQPAPQKPDERGWLRRAWDTASQPLTNVPSEIGRGMSDWLTTPDAESDGPTAGTYMKGAAGGMLEGIGDLVSGLTSPVNLATTAATMGSGTALKAGMPTLARGLNLIGKASGLGTALEGGRKVVSADSTMQQRGQGLMEIAGGAAGMMHTPTASNAPNKPTAPVVPTSKASPISIGTKVTIKAKGQSTNLLQTMTEKGFTFEGLSDEGHFQFKKMKEPDTIMESTVGSHRPKLGPNADAAKNSRVAEALNFPRAVMASADFSAPLRQGIGLVHKKAFWTSLDDMFKAWGSEKSYEAIQQSIADKPLFQERVINGKPAPSFASEAGLKLTDLTDLTSREEAIMSTWAEKVPLVRRSNRAYTAFINKVRADTFEDLVKQGKVFGQDANVNIPLARDLANFVNTATGRGSLGALEKSAGALSTALFSPRLMASRLQYANPRNYLMGSPMARKEFAKSLLAITAMGNTFLQLGKMAGGKVNSDPSSADYGKLQLGRTRLDPWAGFQQYIVLAQRALRPPVGTMDAGKGDTGIVPLDLAAGMLRTPGGAMESTNTGQKYSLDNPKYGGSTRLTTAIRFLRGKSNPVAGMAMGAMDAGREISGEPMNFTAWNPNILDMKHENIMDNTLFQKVTPLLMQDLYDLVREEGVTPKAALSGAYAAFGGGMQEYKKQRPH